MSTQAFSSLWRRGGGGSRLGHDSAPPPQSSPVWHPPVRGVEGERDQEEAEQDVRHQDQEGGQCWWWGGDHWPMQWRLRGSSHVPRPFRQEISSHRWPARPDQTLIKNNYSGTVHGGGYNCHASELSSDEGAWNKISVHVPWIVHTLVTLNETICFW